MKYGWNGQTVSARFAIRFIGAMGGVCRRIHPLRHASHATSPEGRGFV